jgi:hypothetical protein
MINTELECGDRAAIFLPPWIGGPGLISLWEIMKPFVIRRFHGIAWLLGYVQGTYQMQPAAEAANPQALANFVDQLGVAKSECEAMGLRVSAQHLSEEIAFLKSSSVACGKCATIADAVNDSIRREMLSMKLFRLFGDTSRYFDVANAFGDKVSKAFPSAEYDICEAGNCLALSRSTACVFHAMRVLEHGLCALADQFEVPFDNKSWNDVIEPIEKAIRKIKNQPNKPENWKEDEQFYSEAAAQFMHFKNAWRNYTAHRQFKYTEDEAEAIFRHVRDFMMHLARRLNEKKTKR